MDRAGSYHQEEVPVTTIDRFAADEGLQRLDFIKMDVQGWEMRILEGGAGGRPRSFASAHSGGPATSPLRFPSLTAFCGRQTVLKTTRTRPSPGYQ
jgi:hypothetical protein